MKNRINFAPINEFEKSKSDLFNEAAALTRMLDSIDMRLNESRSRLQNLYYTDRLVFYVLEKLCNTIKLDVLNSFCDHIDHYQQIHSEKNRAEFKRVRVKVRTDLYRKIAEL